MSSLLWLAAAAVYGPPAPIAKPAATEQATAESVVAAAEEFYSVVPGQAAPCPAPRAGEILVCADIVDPATQLVPSSIDEGAIRDLVPRAPDLEPRYPGVVVATGCFIPPCPRPMPILIDLKAIPEAPPGSDADRIAKGEIPGP